MLTHILLGLVLTLLIVLTVCGNVLVCLAVGATRRLRCVTNCFIVSLAITDLLLGALVLPFSALLEVRGGEWPLGGAFCNVYISLDVMLSTASILNLLAISVDRYLAVTAPLRYASLLRPARVAGALAAIWLVSVGLSFVPIHMGWNTRDGSVQNVGWNRGSIGVNDNDDSNGGDLVTATCKFDLNASYALVDALCTFYLPLVAMCWSYCRVFRIARAQARRIVAMQPRTDGCIASRSQRVLAVAAREHKATVTLAVVVGAFIICWTPYFSYFTIMGILQREMRGEPYSVVLWLGYANSALNPFLYAALNRDFRSAYVHLLHCQRTKITASAINGGGRGEGGRDSDGQISLHRNLIIPSGSGAMVDVMMQDLDGGNKPPIRNGTSLTMETDIVDATDSISLTNCSNKTGLTATVRHRDDSSPGELPRWLAANPQEKRG